MRREWIAAALVVSLGGPVYAQGLAEAAAKEKERRAQLRQKAGAAKTYDDSDLEKQAEAGSKDKSKDKNAKESAAPAAESSAPSGGSDEGPDRSVWTDRADRLREAIAAAQDKIKTTEDRIAELRLDRNPNPADQFDPNRLQKREAQIAQAMADLDTAKAELAKAQADQQKLEEEARREHVPPGWIR
jgi:hypothetical protein